MTYYYVPATGATQLQQELAPSYARWDAYLQQKSGGLTWPEYLATYYSAAARGSMVSPAAPPRPPRKPPQQPIYQPAYQPPQMPYAPVYNQPVITPVTTLPVNVQDDQMENPLSSLTPTGDRAPGVSSYGVTVGLPHSNGLSLTFPWLWIGIGGVILYYVAKKL